MEDRTGQALPGAPPMENRTGQAWKIGGGGSKKVEKNKFSELGLPGVEIVGAPLETLFTLSRAP